MKYINIKANNVHLLFRLTSFVSCPYLILFQLSPFSSVLGIINISVEATEWIKINVNMSGYYIVNYAEEDWEALIKQLHTDPTVMSDQDRASLINNIFELAGYVSLLDFVF